MKNILIIEDDQDISNLISKALSSKYQTSVAFSGDDGMRTLANNKVDLLILDLMLPDMDGIEICRKVRKSDESLPIFILSAKNEEIDRVMGLELGADDYIPKPFSLRELRARVDGFFRRWDSSKKSENYLVPKNQDEMRRGEMLIDPKKRKVSISGRDVHISKKEFDILYLLAATPGKVFTREKILDIIWGNSGPEMERMIDSHIRRLRTKLSEIEITKEWIETIWGVGYRFSE